ncbi:MAG: beta-lactamase family protein, partial [Acidobacteria bacterium]|nr:beta-lactamase family protein [Acidobacteriota bacterium]
MPEEVSRRCFLKRSSAVALCAAASPLFLKSSAAQDNTALRTDLSARELAADLSRFIPERMNRHNVPGVSIAVIKDARILWSQGFGVKSLESGEPVTTETVFEAASLSKPAFAYAALKLCEEGRLGLDTPLVEYLPEPFIPNEPRLRLITARLVLSHTSGLPHGRARGTPLALRFAPRERFYYSAAGFQYLQMVAERITNQPLSVFMKEKLLDPFGMRQSSFEWLSSYERSAAQGYDDDGEPEPSGLERYRRLTAAERAVIDSERPEIKYSGAAAGLYT